MQQAGEALQQSQQELAQAGQQEGGENQAPGGAQMMAGGDAYGADGMPGGGGKGSDKGMGGGGMGVGSEAGHGTTNERGGTGQMGYNTPKDRQSPERSQMRTRFERIYAPERIATNRLDTQVRGKRGKGKSDYSMVRGAPEASTAARPYYDVYSDYRRVAEDALSKEDVPATYKKQVRDYFDSLKP